MRASVTTRVTANVTARMTACVTESVTASVNASVNASVTASVNASLTNKRPAAKPREVRALPSSDTQGILAGTMRYFRASDIFGRNKLQELESPWELTLAELVPEVVDSTLLLFVAGKVIVEYPRLLLISPRSLNNF